jgi:hypothetical protein
MASFGVLSFQATDNLGDEIQSIAAAEHLPRVDAYFDRDHLNAVLRDDGQPYLMVLNGWFCQYPERWPPSDAIRPLLVSMHFTKERVSSDFGLVPAEILSTPPISHYLKHHGPVGARDLTTLHLLRQAGIPSYFSGCMTLTLQRPAVGRVDDLVVLNDLPKPVLAHVRSTAMKSLFTTTHMGFPDTTPEGRFARAHELLALYARASCVVTGRLHCALPCLAMGTPVLLIDVAADQYRFAGLNDFLHHCSAGEFIGGSFGYDIHNPWPNKTAHFRYREALRRTVAAFVDDAESAVAPQLTQNDAALGPRWKAVRATFLKARAVDSSTLPPDEKLAVHSSAVLAGEPIGSEGGHVKLKSIWLSGERIDHDGWCFYPEHWERIG